ncbi:exopolysaccharide biosynthesis polyprenyl glycosylphosphotransferase [Haloprofundus marisrubri]|uniref:Exopolysaccharide biosynthesis polyprenyl glycosylphosphotransferase n=1 Tax=Haloprofundus marisrubri TaxID=1514971 RepID=A0A0W1R6E7_9EURY|nr:sugar transferase [Haloprofundus marisrubri]KTG09027.1 exopolysaccharide biosynthesis polyprenyl glycosylphosphotransferase [Haloprofundus marisrubri]
MLTGWRYRVVSVVGAASLTALAVYFANHPLVQLLFTSYVPLFNRLDSTVLEGISLNRAVWTTILAVLVSLVPLYKPRPRRILDVVSLTQKHVLIAGLALATFGYFEWSHRLPRATLVVVVCVLLVALPAWFVWIRRRPPVDSGRTVIVGDDPTLIDRIAGEVSLPVLGYVCPTSALPNRRATVTGETDVSDAVADGGTMLPELSHLGGFSRLDDVLVEQHIDTVVLAFMRPDRAEFFGAIDTCHEHGVEVKVHRDYADSVLTSKASAGTLVDVDVEPWDMQDYMLKRAFDVVFAATGLLVSTPLMLLLAVAIKLDSEGPILYSQERTAGFGETFEVYKFRTMVPEGESSTPIEDDDNDRITRVGRVLRRTHLDELPQLWAILAGKMSTVGPRAAWTNEEVALERQTAMWRKRWFVKPGLTGLAQINDAKSTDPDEKLRYDLEYIRRQSFSFDVKIIVRQVWKVFEDVWSTLR